MFVCKQTNMAKREVAVRVAVRVRPLLEGERQRLHGRGEIEEECVKVVSQKQLVLGGEHSFTFDRVLPPESNQADTYQKCTVPLVQSALEGFNATLLAYGQTGSGKTYSLGSGAEVEWDGEKEGIIPRAFKDIFKALQSTPGLLSHTIHASYVEVYKDELRDLLDTSTAARKTLQLREQENGNIVVHGLIEVEVTSANEALSWLQSGNVARITGSTNMNQRSSRSHAIFTLHIEHVKLLSPSFSSTPTASSLDPHHQSSAMSSPSGKQSVASESRPMSSHQHHRVTSKFHFVDLAGSERVGRTGNTGERFKESVHINSGLLALGNVISALGDPKRKCQHVPYRDSKITRLLKDSLGGNTKTVMLACLSPAASNYAETLNTLKYAQRARCIKNKPVVNLDQQVQQMEHMRTEIAALREELSRTRSIAPPPSAPPSSAPLSPLTHHQQLVEEVTALKKKVAQLEGELERCQLDLATDEDMFAEREMELAGLQEQVSTMSVEKIHLEKRVSVYAERERTLHEEILQLTQQVTQLEGELSNRRERRRGRGMEQSTAQPLGETAEQDNSKVFIQQPTASVEEPVSDSLQQEKDNVKTVLDFSLQSLLSSLSARNEQLMEEVTKHSKPLSGACSVGGSEHGQSRSQQGEVQHHQTQHSNKHLPLQPQHSVGGSGTGLLNQMSSLREKEVAVAEHLEGMVQRRRALEQLERELAEREQSLAAREAVLAERDMLDVKRLRASQTAHKEWMRASMKLSAVESSISEREALWREGRGATVQRQSQNAQLHTLQGQREGLLREVTELQNRVKTDSFLSLEEERRLAELSEWVEVMDSALEYRRKQFGARQKKSVLSSLEQKEGGVSEMLKVLSPEDTRHLMMVYLNKMAGLKLKLEDTEQHNQEYKVQLREKDDLVSTLERCLRHCRSELQRRLALQEREHRQQLEVVAKGEGQEGGAEKSLLERKVQELEKELYFYKKTSRDLKKRLKALVQGDHQRQSDPPKDPPSANAAAHNMEGEIARGVPSEEDHRVSQSQPQSTTCREQREGQRPITTGAQSDVPRVYKKSKKELRQLSAEEVTRRIKGASLQT